MTAANLTLEITEGTLLTPGFETVQRIGELRALGLRLAIDDFGTGYSSLGYLHAFQIDELKIDRSFVPGSDGVGDAHVLSQAIVELGRALRPRHDRRGHRDRRPGRLVPHARLPPRAGLPVRPPDARRGRRALPPARGCLACRQLARGQLARGRLPRRADAAGSPRLGGAEITDVRGVRKAAG